jgi:hypothetical protein
MMQGGSFWSTRPTHGRALATAAWVAFLASALAWSATRLSPFSTRSHLALASGELEDLYLTPLAEDPARALLTTRRANSTWARDQASQAGDPYWVRRYGDPARPGLPERILLTSRSRGAHLLIPLAALDLERALAEPLGEGAGPSATPQQPCLRRSLAQVYWSRSFAGVFLHLRFPERVLATEGPEAGQPLDFDLVIVRENELCTTDFLLQPNGELYRAALADGLMPAGPRRRNPLTGDELVLLMRAEPGADGVPLYSPVSLFEELRLCWKAQLGTVVDDRWRLADAAPYATQPPAREVRARVAWNGSLHLAARFESADERRALQQALARFTDS